jgi:hypothetical protein
MPRENTEKLLDMVTEGLFNETILIRDLLNFLDDNDVGEFMSQYGYETGDYEEDEDEESEYPQAEIDAEEEYESFKEFEDWRDTHGLAPLGDLDFEDGEDT